VVATNRNSALGLLADLLLQLLLEVFVCSVLVNEDLQTHLESASKNETLLVVMQRSAQSLASALSPIL
jgi:hypothetical protein